MTNTISSHEFNQDPNRAIGDARNGPVFITDRGKPSHVLMSYDEYARITSVCSNIVEALSMKGLSEVDFDPEKAPIKARSVDLF
ncbi:type II toxin-antitoxin system Phd/YefM family antitoxin [Ascidiaceihabitans sp.]|uniref:type II toxin-antitoxin system Phd/YefM family antitoxin n=1 Tax=Ascidiaceihabitans sp. TaxID=1872644 RepID=UPI0032978368